MTYGKRIKAAREARGFTQYSLGLAIGTRDANISRWERDDLVPKVATLVNISAALGCALDYLAGVSDAMALRDDWQDPRTAD